MSFTALKIAQVKSASGLKFSTTANLNFLLISAKTLLSVHMKNFCLYLIKKALLIPTVGTKRSVLLLGAHQQKASSSDMNIFVNIL
jgi:hypothetical protein